MSQLGQLAREVGVPDGQIVAVAVTATFSQQRFVQELGVGFPLVSDWNRTVCAQYGVRYDVWKGHEGVAKRSLFVIDREGLVRWRWVTDDAEQTPDFTGALAALSNLMTEMETQ